MSELVVLGLMDSAAILTANPADQYRNSVAFRLGVKSIATRKNVLFDQRETEELGSQANSKGFQIIR